jgi:ParB-like chromosome segregation protein Spo0J
VEQENLSETAVIKQALIANCQREELRPLERARAFERLMKEAGWSAAELARRIGVSPATISRLLLLLSSPEIARMVENEKLAADAGYQIAKVSDPAERDRLIEEASKTGLTRDAVAGRAKRKNTNGAAGVTRAAAMLGDRRTVTLAGPGLTLETLIAWLEELLAKARKARPQGLELATFVKMLRDQAKGGKS